MTPIGARIRQARLDHGYSQGDVEARTGLLRCYLSRVENGHTEPSLQTLARLAQALDMPLAAFFADDEAPPQPPAAAPLNPDDLAFLAAMQQAVASLSDADRQRVLALAKKMAATQ